MEEFKVLVEVVTSKLEVIKVMANSLEEAQKKAVQQAELLHEVNVEYKVLKITQYLMGGNVIKEEE